MRAPSYPKGPTAPFSYYGRVTASSDAAQNAANQAKRPRAAREPVLTAAVDVARAAVEEFLSPDQIGEHLGVQVEGNRLVTHYFATNQPGYVGWHWAVTLARIPRGRRATVCEVALLPGEGAKLPPKWVPWADRLEPDDVSPTDVLPYDPEDVRLVPGFTDTSEDADKLEIEELGLGRVRVMSPEGFDRAATRWYEGDHGPNTPGARATRSKCATCGFFMKLAGTPRRMFGVCGNEWSPDDGRVVSIDHGCGAHSETDVPYRPPLWNPPAVVMDEGEMEHFELPRREKPAEEEPAEEAEEEDSAADE